MEQNASASSSPSQVDVRQCWIRALEYSSRASTAGFETLPFALRFVGERFAERIALSGECASMTFAGLLARANQYARWGLSIGLKKGSVVGLLMPNCPDYVAIWAGLTRIGCSVALLNTNLFGEPLLHCVQISHARHVIIEDSLAQAAPLLKSELGVAVHVWRGDQSSPACHPNLYELVVGLADHDLDDECVAYPRAADKALLIYTSGTTGLPKAAVVTHGRIMEWGLWFAGMMNATSDDRLYDCLPMYHSTGGVVAICAMLLSGGSVVIRKKFSASRFWPDVTESGSTIIQYIGEFWRFLLHMPPCQAEAMHGVRLACGNGLQADVWARAEKRFGISNFLEFYAATEGVLSLYNCEGKVGSVGRIPAFLRHRFPIKLVQYDPESGVLRRNHQGFCVECEPDEAGEAIVQLTLKPDGTIGRFSGYSDSVASGKKLLRNAFAKGDVWFLSGDLLRRDKAGFFYFVDRLGDTFRWRGENVSTTEVAEILQACPGLTAAVVYGVAIPGHEGRAGMAAVTTDESFAISAFRRYVENNLPPYARPVFLRQCLSLDMTATFKLQKTRLAQEGYDCRYDPIWFNDHEKGQFVPVDDELRDELRRGRRRL